MKRALIERIEAVRRPGTIVTSNTSGIPIAVDRRRAQRRVPPSLARHALLQPATLPAARRSHPDGGHRSRPSSPRCPEFADRRLGKGVVVAKDTPNFIANRIGLYGVISVLRTLETGALTIEDIDAITGPALGRPKSATFRTMDIAGLDVLGHVARNLLTQLPADEATALRAAADRPDAHRTGMGRREERAGLLQTREDGRRARRFSRSIRRRSPTAPGSRSRLPALDAARAIEDVAERTKTLFLGTGQRRRLPARHARLPAALRRARRARDRPLDRRCRSGDAMGLWLGSWARSRSGMRSASAKCWPQRGDAEPPPIVAELLRAGRNRFRDGALPPAGPDRQLLATAERAAAIVKKNPGASLVDLGDGVLAVEFHSKMNTVGGDTLEMLHAGVREAAANFAALVVGNDAPNFSAGANLMLLLLEAQEGNWDDIDLMVRTFQGATQALRYCGRAGRGLPGRADAWRRLRDRAARRPDAGGRRKLHRPRRSRRRPDSGRRRRQGDAGAQRSRAWPIRAPICCRACRRCSRRSASRKSRPAPPTPLRLGYLRPVDAITMNRERLMADAKAVALERVREGYRPPVPRTAIPVGGDAVLAPLKLGVHLAWRAGRISDHDAARRPDAGRRPRGRIAAASDDRVRSSTCSISSARRS